MELMNDDRRFIKGYDTSSTVPECWFEGLADELGNLRWTLVSGHLRQS